MVEGPFRLDGLRYTEGEGPGGPECRKQVRVVRTVETEVRRDPGDGGRRPPGGTWS